MTVISSRIPLALSRTDAWQKLQDISLPHNYVPGIIKTEIKTDQKTGVGASRLVFQNETKSLDETVLEWNEGWGFVIRVHQGDKGAPPPFKELNFEYGLEEEGGQVYLHNRMSYTPAWGFLGALLDKLVLTKAIGGSLRDVTLAQKLFYETGQPTTAEALSQKKSELATAAQ